MLYDDCFIFFLVNVFGEGGGQCLARFLVTIWLWVGWFYRKPPPSPSSSIACGQLKCREKLEKKNCSFWEEHSCAMLMDMASAHFLHSLLCWSSSGVAAFLGLLWLWGWWLSWGEPLQEHTHSHTHTNKHIHVFSPAPNSTHHCFATSQKLSLNNSP